MAYDLKSESEVKDYIQNLGIEYRFGCYSEKKADGMYAFSIQQIIAMTLGIG